MKRIFIIIAIAAAFCACQKVQPVSSTPDGPEMIKVRAVFADGELSSKASLAEGSDQFEWNSSDKVVAWNGESATTNCAITDIDASGVATFSVPANTQWVIYPSAALTVSDNTAQWTRPAIQPSEDGKLVGSGANPMFGRVNGDVVEFTNLCGYIQFKFTGSKVLKRFSFKSNNMSSPALSGRGNINVSATKPELSYPVLSEVSTSGTNQFGYTNVDNLNLQLNTSTATPVMIVVPAATYEAGEIILEFSDNTSLTIISKNDLTVKRNTVLKVKTIDVDSRFPASSVALDEGGRSNCYLVVAGESAQAYSFKASSILGDNTFDLAKTANIVWAESKDLINNIIYDGNTHRVTFLYNGEGREGNALVALDQNLQNQASTLLWNYHIWITDKPSDIKMDDNAMPVPIMDRNVGATWAPATAADVTGMTEAQWLESVGTYYQYGNHIPYPRISEMRNSSSAWDNNRNQIQYGFSNYCQKMAASASVKNSLEEQEQMCNYEYQLGTGNTISGNNEQIWTNVKIKGSSVGDDAENIWLAPNGATQKASDYDPCPQGYIFVGATHLYRATTTNKTTSQYMNSNYAGKYHSNANGDLLYYPAAGYLSQGKVAMVGGNASARVVYWSYYTGSDMAAGLFRRVLMNESNNAFSAGSVPFSAQAHNMRCAKLK